MLVTSGRTVPPVPAGELKREGDYSGNRTAIHQPLTCNIEANGVVERTPTVRSLWTHQSSTLRSLSANSANLLRRLIIMGAGASSARRPSVMARCDDAAMVFGDRGFAQSFQGLDIDGRISRGTARSRVSSAIATTKRLRGSYTVSPPPVFTLSEYVISTHHGG